MNTSTSFSASKLIPIIITAAVIVGGAFYGGMKYVESKNQRGELSQADFQSLRNLSPEERQQRFQELGANIGGIFDQDHEREGFRGRFGSGNGSRSLSGEIISQSEGSFIIKLSDSSTKIVFISDSTQITKSVDGTLDDLNEGEQIFVIGNENPDGSYTAETIQLSPRYLTP